jgi:hypothetical protein
VTVIVADLSGNPVTDADVVLDISPAMFMNQGTHYVLNLNTVQQDDGIYVATFASVVEGPIIVVATERNTLASADASVEFTAPPDPPERIDGTMPGIHSISGLQTEPAPDDAKKNCKDFFEKLDDVFYPPILLREIAKIPAGKAGKCENGKCTAGDPARIGKKCTKDSDCKELEQRLADVIAVLGPIDDDIKEEKKQAEAKKDKLDDKQLEDLKKEATKIEDSFKRISDKQDDLLKQFFGNPIDFKKFQDCTEMFNNFELVEDFDKAVKTIKEGGMTVVRGPDAAIAHIRWAKFANLILVIPDIGKDRTKLWQNLKPILAKGSAITVGVLTIKGGRKPMMLDRNSKEFKDLRKEYDDLRPADTEDKLKKLEKKLINLAGTAENPKSVLSQLPLRDT